MHRVITIMLAVLGIGMFTPAFSVVAQTEVTCGQIIEGEFTQESEAFAYQITFVPGDSLEASVKPFGSRLKVTLVVYTPTGKYLMNAGREWIDVDGVPEKAPHVNTGGLDGRGTYTVVLANSNVRKKEALDSGQAGTGPFTLYIGCTLKDGTVIKPGDTTQPTQPTLNPPLPAPPTFGFPGLAPVDFSKATKLKLPPSGEVAGEISPEGGNVLGFTFDATEGQQFDLTFARTAGNLNLGLVILSSDNKVYFQTSLVASSELITKLTLPAGKYTLGIFKIDLVAPASAETTEFEITLK